MATSTVSIASILAESLENDREEAATSLDRGRKAFREGDYEAAIGFWESAGSLFMEIGDDASLTSTTLNVALAYQKKGQFGAAVPALMAVLQADPTHQKALYRLLQNLVAAGKAANTDNLRQAVDWAAQFDSDAEFHEAIKPEMEQIVAEITRREAVGVACKVT